MGHLTSYSLLRVPPPIPDLSKAQVSHLKVLTDTEKVSQCFASTTVHTHGATHDMAT